MNNRLYIYGLITLTVLMTGCVAASVGTATQPALISTTQQPVVSAISSAPSFPYSSPVETGTTADPATEPGINTFEAVRKAFPGTVILGRPTNDGVSLSLLASLDAELYIEYGKMSGKYGTKTAVSKLQKDQPLELTIAGLEKGTLYYYRICHKTAGETGFSAAAESSFHTQRALGDSFVFTVDADPHWDSNADPQKLALTFQNILNEHSDFNIDLGDTFMTEKLKARNYTEASGVYIDKRSDFSIFGGSTPLFLAIGNHDGESGGAVNSNENSVAVWASKARELYYPNPFPDGFYSGNNISEPFVGMRENYYSWQWGDALYVVLDPYWYSTSSKNLTGWNVTLGKKQYDWLKTTLEKSKAKFKFVFAHNLIGGFDLGTVGNMRGGTEAAGFYEWGGQNEDGSWGFDQNRPGWEKPIHQLLVENQVTIFFHGHDHFFAKQELDGVIYQECPQPGATNEKLNPEQYGYVDGVFFSSPGHLRVTVSKDTVKVDYIKTYLQGQEPAGHHNGEIAYSYTIEASP